jgi:hypothetical protein
VAAIDVFLQRMAPCGLRPVDFSPEINAGGAHKS